jgi:peptidoglycan/xylan/chitin deacetylase (PgdA/CDA1 family)
MIFRNDDVSHETNLQQFAAVHELFKKYNVLHTVALICKDIQKAPALIKYINDNNIDVQVHAWEHADFTQLTKDEMRVQFKKSIACIKKYFKKTPDTFYPPWNRTNAFVEEVAAEFSLTVKDQKISLSQYLRGATGEVINFHSWSDECNDLEPALIKYTKK